MKGEKKKKDHTEKCKLEGMFFILAQKGCSKKLKSNHVNSIVLPDFIPGETNQDFSTICDKKPLLLFMCSLSNSLADFQLVEAASSFVLWEDPFSFISLLQAPSLLPAFS